LGVHGDTRHGQSFEVAPGRARAHFELLAQLFCRDPTPGLQDQEGGYQSIGPHDSSVTLKVAIRWPLYGRTLEEEPAIAAPAAEMEIPMPGLVPPVTDERTGLLSYLAQQRAGIRYATHGLTDAQAMSRPSVSELSLGGLVKHAALVEQAWIGFLQDGDMAVFVPDDDWADGFRFVDGETLADVVSFSADVARNTEKVVSDLPDLGMPLAATGPGVPWIPSGLVWSPRWVLLHLIEETARHAGHADIVRESLDGATCWTLMAAAEGWEEVPWEGGE